MAQRPTKFDSDTRNLWDCILPEIQDRILDLSDALTQFLHSHGKYDGDRIKSLPKAANAARSCLAPRRIKDEKRQLQNDIWSAALEMEWNGDLKTLPGEFNPYNQAEWYDRVKTKSMWTRLFGQLDRSQGWTPMGSVADSIAMRHCWINMLSRPIEEYVYNAASGGHLQLMIHIESRGLMLDDYKWKMAACQLSNEGRIEDIRYLLSTKPQCIDGTVVVAAAGQLEMLDFLLGQGNLQCPNDVAIWAARGGHLNVLQYLHNKNGEGFTPIIMDIAANFGDIEMVKFLHCSRNEGCSWKAFDHKHSDILEFLCKHYPQQYSEYLMQSQHHQQ
ncbi:hypothetical protein HDV05_004175 [Chytridiales sp. JEL 0842]|nr:hypothetical protein HDV05_004175 [Chytridiales sp. JEL 0842]